MALDDQLDTQVADRRLQLCPQRKNKPPGSEKWVAKNVNITNYVSSPCFIDI